ncbi:MAG: AMP-dependent synthetase/ligase [Gammaproteobacteria bacterium]
MIKPGHPFHSELCRRIGHTLPGRLAVFAHHWPDRAALREKHRGLWRAYSWAQYLEQALAVAESLAQLGLKPGDSIAIISDNRPEWLFADVGAQALGVLSAGVYVTNPAPDVAFVLNHCRARVVFCEDQEQVDKVLGSPEPLSALERIVVIETEGTRDYGDPRLVSWDEFIAPGLARARARSTDDVQRQLQALDAGRPAVIVYTSGTTAQPKGALLSASQMLALSQTYFDEIGGNEDDTLLSYLPLCHVAEKIFSQFTPLSSGATVHFGESLDTVRQDLVDVSPTIFLGVPRIWEKIHAGVEVAIRNTTPEKRALYDWAMRVATRHHRKKGDRTIFRGENSSVPFLRWLADVLVLRALRERLGLARARLAISGAAPIAPELLHWFHAIGVPIMEGWGLSESCGISHVNLPGAYRIGSVGRPMRGVDCKLDEDGEILIKGPHIFSGYLHNEAATREVLHDGWLRTGDLGAIDADGYLSIVGRKKEILINAGGKNLSPAKIENALKTSPYIKEAAAVADGRAFTTALIQIEGELVGDWATRRGLSFTSFEDLSAKPEVVKLIDDEVRRINESLARVEQVRGFRLLPKELHQDDGEMTATQKLKRRVVYTKFAALIDQMYAKGAA